MDAIDKIIAGTRPSSFTFLVGENGSGKSSLLAELARREKKNGRPVIAISNTVYDKFPRSKGSYSEIAALYGSALPVGLLKKTLASSFDDQFRSLERISKILDYLGFAPMIGVSTELRPDEIGRKLTPRSDISFSEEEYKRLLNALNVYWHTRSEDGIVWLDAYAHGYESLKLAVLDMLKADRLLRKHRAMVKLHLKKGPIILDLARASSGELTLLSLYAYLSTEMREGALLLIDEPENSLHPRWQHEYCSRLLDMFYLYEPSVVVATHSPVVVSGAQGHSLDLSIMRAENADVSELHTGRDIERILYDVFKTLSPANHFLSRQVSDLLAELSAGKISRGEFDLRLSEFKNRSYDEKQRKFLTKVNALADKVASSEEQDDDF
jgi:predicted ATPase